MVVLWIATREGDIVNRKRSQRCSGAGIKPFWNVRLG